MSEGGWREEKAKVSRLLTLQLEQWNQICVTLIEIPSKLFGIVPSKDLPRLHKEIVKRIIPAGIQVDTMIYQRRGLLRIPNTINKKSNLYKISIQVDELNNLNINEIKEIAINTNLYL